MYMFTQTHVASSVDAHTKMQAAATSTMPKIPFFLSLQNSLKQKLVVPDPESLMSRGILPWMSLCTGLSHMCPFLRILVCMFSSIIIVLIVLPLLEEADRLNPKHVVCLTCYKLCLSVVHNPFCSSHVICINCVFCILIVNVIILIINSYWTVWLEMFLLESLN